LCPSLLKAPLLQRKQKRRVRLQHLALVWAEPLAEVSPLQGLLRPPQGLLVPFVVLAAPLPEC